jgi:hemerythrin-like domain-containing protein
MRRDTSLIPLSHQHHNGLALCVLTRRSLAGDDSPENVTRQAKRIIDRFELELVNHFAIEEEVLFPLCGALPLVNGLIADHRDLEGLVAQLRQAPSPQLLEQFCTLLTTHIRREEGELFEQIQRDLPRETLDQAGAEIDRRAVRVCL